MGSIIWFFIRYQKVLIFILLEIISLYLVITYNEKPHSAFVSVSTELSGQVNSLVAGVNDYFHLRRANDSLLAENARLRKELMVSHFYDTATSKVIHDSVNQQRYTYIPAQVVSNTVHEQNNFFTLAAGNNKGISTNQGVITSNGIAGITINTSTHFAYVMSVLHKDFRVQAEIVENGEVGSVSEWNGRSPRVVQLRNVPVHAKIQKGQHVVTSAYSTAFPKGTPVGAVDTFYIPAGSAYYTIDVRLASNMQSLHSAYVVNHLMKMEQDSVEVNPQGNN